MRLVPLRRRLFLLAAATILPLAIASGIAGLALVHQQRTQAQRAAIELTRALATGIDAELRRAVSVLEALATSLPLDKGDLAAFYPRAQRVLATRPYWLTINLAAPSGKMILSTSLPLGAELPAVVETASFATVVETRRPVIGALSTGQRQVWAVPVRVPVIRNDELRYVLTAAVKPDAILDVVNRQRVPDDWVVSVFDANGLRVARSTSHEQFIGMPAAPSLQTLMSNGREEGWGFTHSLEGNAIYSAFTRLRDSGWSVAIGIPTSVVDGAAYRSLAVYGGGIFLSLVLGVLAALWAARTINRPIGELRDAAQALGGGGRPAAASTDIAEIQAVSDALVGADVERSRAEAERERLLALEREARASAEAANRAKDEFLAMLGHELRNPLGAIANAARLLEHPRTDAEGMQRARAIIGRQVDHLARMTDDLLDAGRAITGKIVLHRAPLDLAAAVGATLATLRQRTERHRVAHDLREVWVDADATRIEQIVANLVINAVKYTRPGGNVRVAVFAEAGEAVLRVADDGIGMPRDLTARVFELFVQGERDLDRALGGLGIGLTLVRRLAELHGGSAQAASAGPERGSEFTVRLPAIARPDTLAERAPAAPVRARDILIVEDNRDARETLKKLLELAGHRVRAEADGEAGLRAALAAAPEVALVDIGLPKMDGYELARRLREAERGSGARRALLVAVTGYGLPEERDRALAAGFDEHLVKPVDEAALDALLASRR